MLLQLVFLILPTIISGAALGSSRRNSPTSRNIIIRNQSGRRLDVFWINTNDNPYTYHSNSENGEGYPFGSDSNIASFIGHEFEFREMPSKKTNKCLYDECRKAYVRVNDQEGQEVTIDRDYNVVHTDDRKKAQRDAQKLLSECQAEIQKIGDGIDPIGAIDAISGCMQERVNKTLAEREEERQFQSSLRVTMAEKLVPYACGDINFTQTEEIVNRSWHFEELDGKYKAYQLAVLHERPTSQIYVVPNFASEAECEAVTSFVKDGKVPFATLKDRTKTGKVMKHVASKIYELARKSMGWDSLQFGDMQKEGHALFESVEDGVGMTLAAECTGDESKNKDRVCRMPGDDPLEVSTRKFVIGDNQVSTSFLFCKEPEQNLGGINFPYAGVHVNPKKGMLVMALYRSLNATELDGYVTEYHLCPNHNVLTQSFTQARGG